MPRKNPKQILAAVRAAEARRIVARQEQLIAGLKASGKPTLDAEQYLQMYIGALKHLEDHEHRIKEARKAKMRETKKK